MVLSQEYCKANVPITIRNQFLNCYYDNKSFKSLIIERCFTDNHNGICSSEEYYKACIEYLNNMKYSKNGYKKWIQIISNIYDPMDWKEELNNLGCKSNFEFIKLAKFIIEG